RIGPQQLPPQVRARAGPSAAVQLRSQFAKAGLRQQTVRHPNELGHAPVDATNARQYITKNFVDQPFHGRQGNLHAPLNPANKKGKALYGPRCALPDQHHSMVSVPVVAPMPPVVPVAPVPLVPKPSLSPWASFFSCSRRSSFCR